VHYILSILYIAAFSNTKLKGIFERKLRTHSEIHEILKNKINTGIAR
jgi:hypothetical protein